MSYDDDFGGKAAFVLLLDRYEAAMRNVGEQCAHARRAGEEAMVAAIQPRLDKGREAEAALAKYRSGSTDAAFTDAAFIELYDAIDEAIDVLGASGLSASVGLATRLKEAMVATKKIHDPIPF